MLKDRIFFSIIIPVYNAEKTITACLESILCQEFLNYEIVCVDDGSSDKSYEILKSYEKVNDKINIYRKQNEGVSSARNYGIEKARGEWIFFVDSDDLINRETLNILYANLANYNTDLILFKIAPFKNNKVKQQRNLNITKMLSKEDVIKSLFCDFSIKGYVCNKLFKKSIILSNNVKFDTELTINEDLVFCNEYCQYITNAICINLPLYYYLQYENSATRSSVNENSMTYRKAFGILHHKYKDSEFDKYVEMAYMDMTIFLIKKMIQYGVVEQSIYDQLYNEIMNFKSIGYMSKKQKIYYYVFKYIIPKQLLYKIVRMRNLLKLLNVF